MEHSFVNQLKYFISQFILFSIIIVIAFFSDKYISKPFTYIDLLAIGALAISVILIVIVNLNSKLHNSLSHIRKLYKILFSIMAVILATIFIGLVTGEIIL